MATLITENNAFGNAELQRNRIDQKHIDQVLGLITMNVIIGRIHRLDVIPIEEENTGSF